MRKRQSSAYYINGVLSGNRAVLGQAITIFESNHRDDRDLSSSIMEGILPYSGYSRRIGITGPPGVGKSTFLDGFGKFLIEKEKKIAVLAVDPSSTISGGSILGDKTRMDFLANNLNAFIRPSPSRNNLGGVAGKTREIILLCEAAGYEIIFIETVGVGQSETTVSTMVDFFLVLLMPGSGDELQGIKKGIIELADGIIIHKADGNFLQSAKAAKTQLQSALHFLSGHGRNWTTWVELCSSLEHIGYEKIWNLLDGAFVSMGLNLAKNRNSQNLQWFKELVKFEVESYFFEDQAIRTKLNELEKKVLLNEIPASFAARKIAEEIFTRN